MGRKSSAKRDGTPTNSSLPRIVFVDGEKVIRTTEYFHLFSAFVRDYLDQMKPPQDVYTNEVRVPLPEFDEFYPRHIGTVSDFLDAFKRAEKGWYKKCFGKSPTINKDMIVVTPPKWAFEFCDRLEQQDLVGLANASDFLDIPLAKSNVCAYVARKTDGMNVLEMREYLRIDDDYTPEDWEEFARDPDFREVMEADGLMPAVASTSGAN